MKYIWVLILCIGSLAAYAQGNGVIEGTVMGESQEPVIGAIITISSGTQKKAGAVSDINGSFFITLPVGKYEIYVSYVDDKKIRIIDVPVRNDSFTNMNLYLPKFPNSDTTIEFRKTNGVVVSKLDRSFDKARFNCILRDESVLIKEFTRQQASRIDSTRNSGGTRGNTIVMLDGKMIRKKSPPGSIKGKVTIANGIAVGKAKVILFTGGKKVLKTKTNAIGEYNFQHIIPGPYELKIIYKKYKKSVSSFSVESNKQQLINVTLSDDR